MKDACGVVGAAFPESDAALPIYYSLYAIQHRGQESAGIAIAHNGVTRSIKGTGIVPWVFKRADLLSVHGSVGIGHVRYSTSGGSGIENAQPLTVNFGGGTIAIAHNGNLVNSEELRRELEQLGHVFLSDSDTEVIAHLLVKELMRNDIPEAIRRLMRRLKGSYSLVILVNDILVAVRDPLGFKPLCFGKVDSEDGHGYIVASESVAIEVHDGEFIRDVRPGEVLVITGDQMESHQLYTPKNAAHCVFEYVYFARPDSIIDGRLVYDVRLKIGERLAAEHPVESDMVSPVPDSGITSAIGYSKKSGIEYIEALMKNRYVGRTFIMPSDSVRKKAVQLKLNTIKPNIAGRRVILIDDSIVRGNTSRRIVDRVKKAGASEVHVRIGSPPIISPCYLGIDMPTRAELIASHKSIPEVETAIHAETLGYLSVEGLVEATGIPASDLCLGCLTGVYPVEIPGERCALRQLRLEEFDSGE
ncbi:MAG: amidophosphoribosyltransferase [Candidatus Methanogasteraceae archaeon]